MYTPTRLTRAVFVSLAALPADGSVLTRDQFIRGYKQIESKFDPQNPVRLRTRDIYKAVEEAVFDGDIIQTKDDEYSITSSGLSTLRVARSYMIRGYGEETINKCAA